MNEQPQQTPLIDLLRAVPKDLRAQWPIQWTEDGHETGHAMCPLGRLVHEAADRIVELEAAHARYAGSGEAVLLEDSAHTNAGLIHVGFTNPYQIDYAKESEGAFYPDTENDCWIPLFMLRAHKHRLEWSGVCEDCPPADYPTDETRCEPCPRRSPAPAVPEGYALVPVIPTPAMKTAATELDVLDSCLTWEEAEAVYKAMLTQAKEAS